MRKKLIFVMLALLAAILLSGCGPVQGSNWPGLSTDGETAYLANGAQVFAVNVKDGTEAWHYPEPINSKQSFIAAPVVTPDGLVIVGSAGNDHSLIAINPEKVPNIPSGFQGVLCSLGWSKCPEYKVEAKWTFTGATDHWVASPLIIGNRLFAPNADGNLYVLDFKNGQLIKTIELEGRLWATPITDGKRIFVTSLDRSVFGVDLETYKFWHKDLKGAVPGSPVLGADGMLYAGSLTKQLEKIDPVTGDHVQATKTEDSVWNAPTADGDTLYFGDVSGNFYSFDTKAGVLNWTKKPDDAITASPLVLNDNIIVATESGAVYEINKEGLSDKWVTPGGKIYTTPVIAGDLILIAPLGATSYLFAYDPEGHEVWAFPPKK